MVTVKKKIKIPHSEDKILCYYGNIKKKRKKAAGDDRAAFFYGSFSDYVNKTKTLIEKSEKPPKSVDIWLTI